MNQQLGISNVRRAAAVAFALIMAFALMATFANGQAEAGKKKKKAKPTKVMITNVQTANQQQLLSKKKLTVKVKSTGKASPRLSVVSGGKSGYFKAVTVKFKRKSTKTVNLALTGAGRTALAKCGAKTVLVKANYKRKVGKKNKKAKASKKKTLAKWAGNSNCEQPPNYVTVDLGDNPEQCDFLDRTICLQPFPNDYYTKADPSTPTGKRLNLGADSTPVNTGANTKTHLDVTDINRADGFSPGNPIIIKIPGLDTPAAFSNTGLVPLEDISDYKRADQPVILIDAATGERQAIWAELDSNPTSVDPSDDGPGGIGANPTNTGPVNLMIRPAKNLEYGHRYIVAFRNLKDGNNAAIESPLGFRVYRDNLPTQQDIVENRRPHMESVIGDLVGKAGVDRSSLYMAWDFTVASRESITGRALTIRDDAFARLGDDDLADRKIDGVSPTIDVLAYCDKSDTASPQCGNNYPGNETFPTPEFDPDAPVTSPVPGAEEQRTVVGYIRNVPCYLDINGCPPGAKFSFKPNGELDWNPSFTMDVPFRCLIPMSVVNTGTVVPGGTGTYGHGLLGALNQINATRTAANKTNSSWCAANWDGFSNLDILDVILPSLGNMSNFNKAVDRMQQGFVNFMYLQRALAHPDGFADEEAFLMDHNGNTPITPASAIDTSAGEDTRGYYYGISQGGIMGGALTALSPDVDYGVLGVPGINYSTLLRRSVDSDEYFKTPGLLYSKYPDEASRPLLLSLMQLLWDRGEGNGYAEAMTDKPLPNTNSHEVLLQLALGDHQVSNYAAEVEARTIGAVRYAPTLVPARTWDMDYEALPPVSTFPTDPDQSYMVYYDSGPKEFTGTRGVGVAMPPLENVPPRTEWGYGRDPHGDPRASVDANNHIETFYADGTIDACPGAPGAEGYCFANGWDGTSGL